MNKLVVGKGAEEGIRRGQRLVFGNSVESVKGKPEKGELVELIDAQGKFIAQGYYNPKAAVQCQILSTSQKEKIDLEFYRKKIENANNYRTNRLGFEESYRLFYGESDGIPGLLIDRFNEIASVQISCPGVEAWKGQIAQILLKINGIKTVFERNDSRNRSKVGLPILKGLLAGEKKLQTVIREGKVLFNVDVSRGHKTGFYLDQRENRIELEKYVHSGDQMLDVFSYTGGFGLHAAALGAEVSMVDLKEALAEARKNAKLNNFESIEFLEGQAFEETKKLFGRKDKFDIVSCDPPAFVQKREDLEAGKKAYHQINYNCLKLVKEGGLLVSSSCSHFLNEEEFLDVLEQAAANAGRRVSVIEKRGPARDHLTPIASEKGQYLKCIFLRVE
ncbi:MAG: class I SAM-dependent rRNA methyltransferase [Candidatus Diapherotrites archaeon]